MAKEEKDWRLTNQEKWLKGVTLHRSAYKLHTSDKSSDHDHGEFCWAKFALWEGNEVLKEGYTTDDEYHWICPACFEDFKGQFEWKLAT